MTSMGNCPGNYRIPMGVIFRFDRRILIGRILFLKCDELLRRIFSKQITTGSVCVAKG